MKTCFPLLVALLLVTPLTVAAQSPNSTTGAAQMKQLEFLVGNWKGTGWMQMGPDQRETASVTESVQAKVGGRVFVIEGLGKAKLPGKDEEQVVHSAFAFLYYDEPSQRYVMRAFLANGQTVDAETSFAGGVFIWGFQMQYGKMRYKLRLNDKGQWFEEGEMSRDGGKTYFKFFEMTLDRVK